MNPPSVAWDASPRVGLCVNEQWATYISGLLSPAERETFWAGDQRNASQAVMHIQEALFTICEVLAMVDVVIIADDKAQNTPGGTFNSGAWQVRNLNTKRIDPANLVQVGVPSANRFTVAPGQYVGFARCPAYSVDRHQARLYNETDASVVEVGGNVNAAAAGFGETDAWVIFRLNLTSAKAFRLEHRCLTSNANIGFGLAANWGTETYAMVLLLRLGDAI